MVATGNVADCYEFCPYAERPSSFNIRATQQRANEDERSMKNIKQLRETAHWDAGDMGCGRLIVGLKRHLNELRVGELLKITTRDAGALADIPSWCRLSGHELVAAHHPDYLIKKTSTNRKTS
jgi:tRNA 2-thiouridine synthesizing protein A